MKKKWALLFVILLLCCCCAACGGEETADEPAPEAPAATAAETDGHYTLFPEVPGFGAVSGCEPVRSGSCGENLPVYCYQIAATDDYFTAFWELARVYEPALIAAGFDDLSFIPNDEGMQTGSNGTATIAYALAEADGNGYVYVFLGGAGTALNTDPAAAIWD